MIGLAESARCLYKDDKLTFYKLPRGQNVPQISLLPMSLSSVFLSLLFSGSLYVQRPLICHILKCSCASICKSFYGADVWRRSVYMGVFLCCYFTSRTLVGCRQEAAVSGGNVPCVQPQTSVARRRKPKEKNIHIIHMTLSCFLSKFTNNPRSCAWLQQLCIVTANEQKVRFCFFVKFLKQEKGQPTTGSQKFTGESLGEGQIKITYWSFLKFFLSKPRARRESRC